MIYNTTATGIEPERKDAAANKNMIIQVYIFNGYNTFLKKSNTKGDLNENNNT